MLSHVLTVDFSAIPSQLETLLNIDSFSAGILASSLLLMLTLFPTVLLFNSVAKNSGGNAVTIGSLLVGLPVIGVCVALGWLPIWLFVLIVLLVAVLYARTMPSLFGG